MSLATLPLGSYTPVSQYLYFSVLQCNSPCIESSGHPARGPGEDFYLAMIFIASLGPHHGLDDILSQTIYTHSVGTFKKLQ